MKFSASLIIRNEETEIYDCLVSLLGCDEICLLDTGSVDATADEVERFRRDHFDVPVIYETGYEWRDDFAHARNAAADLCSGDWALAISADGRMTPGSVARLRQAIRHTQADTMALTQRAASGSQTHRRVLAWRLRSGIEWQGRVHENLSHDSGETATDVVMTYGWSASHHHDPDRNLRILRAMVKEEPTGRTLYYLGAELYEKGLDTEALRVFRRCVKASQWRAERGDAWLYLAKIHKRRQDWEQARLCVLKCLANTPDCREALLLMAALSWEPEAVVWRRYAENARNTGLIFVRM